MKTTIFNLKYYLTLPIFSSLLTFSLTSQATEIPVTQGEEVNVTATRRIEHTKNSITPTLVITSKELRSNQYQSVSDVLTSAGIQSYSSGGQGQMAGLFLRGTKNSQILVLIDGIRMESATAGRTAIEAIPIEQIDRIEIVKGSMSSLYGANAIGGVIQIFTKNVKASQENGIQTQGSVTIGTDNTQKITAGLNAKSQNTSAFINIGYTHLGNFSAMNAKANSAFYQPFDPDNDKLESRSITAGIQHQLNDRHSIGLNLLNSKLRNHYDGGLGLDHLNTQELSSIGLNSKYQINQDHAMTLKLSLSEDNYADIKPTLSVFKTKSDQFIWQHDGKFNAEHQLSIGYDYLKQKVSSNSTNYTVDSRTVNGVFLGYQADINAHHVQLNLRYDDNSQFGSQNSGSLGYAFDINSNLKLNASIGKAYSMPTFNDLYYPSSAYYSGNPNLKPEESNQYQVGLQWIHQAHRLNVNYFNWKTKNLIVYSSDPITFVGTMSNVDKANNDGIEIDYRYALNGWKLNAHLTLQNPKNEANGKLLQRRAKEFVSFNLMKDVNERWSVGGELIASSHRFDDATETKKLAGYGLVHLISNYKLDKHWTVSGRIENLFDKNYELVSGYNTPSRGAFVTIRYQ